MNGILEPARLPSPTADTARPSGSSRTTAVTVTPEASCPETRHFIVVEAGRGFLIARRAAATLLTYNLRRHWDPMTLESGACK